MERDILIRAERDCDIERQHIRALTQAAFENVAYSAQNEAFLIEALRDAQALSVSLVAELHHDIVGYIAFSPVKLNGADCGWYGLAPLSVHPAFQRKGIGASLVLAGLETLESKGAQGCVVLGDPAYYSRFGFACDAGLKYEGAPAEYFQGRVFTGNAPEGVVQFHEAFERV